jgi:hypothetical protein
MIWGFLKWGIHKSPWLSNLKQWSNLGVKCLVLRLPEVFATWPWMIWGAPEAPKIAIVVIFIPHPSRIIAKPCNLAMISIFCCLNRHSHGPTYPTKSHEITMKCPWNHHYIHHFRSSNPPSCSCPSRCSHPPSREVRWKGRPQTLSSCHGLGDKTSWFS